MLSRHLRDMKLDTKENDGMWKRGVLDGHDGLASKSLCSLWLARAARRAVLARAGTATSSRSRLSGSSPAVAGRGDEARALGALWSRSTKLQLRLCRDIGAGFANASHVLRPSVLCCMQDG